jgi:hypothetical protein
MWVVRFMYWVFSNLQIYTIIDYSYGIRHTKKIQEIISKDGLNRLFSVEKDGIKYISNNGLEWKYKESCSGIDYSSDGFRRDYYYSYDKWSDCSEEENLLLESMWKEENKVHRQEISSKIWLEYRRMKKKLREGVEKMKGKIISNLLSIVNSLKEKSNIKYLTSGEINTMRNSIHKLNDFGIETEDFEQPLIGKKFKVKKADFYTESDEEEALDKILDELSEELGYELEEVSEDEYIAKEGKFSFTLKYLENGFKISGYWPLNNTTMSFKRSGIKIA